MPGKLLSAILVIISSENSDIIFITSSLYFNLSENLLEWSRSQAGAISFNPKHISVGKIINANIELFKKEAKDKNIQIHHNIDENLLVWADDNMITTVIRNLLSNAIKFTYPNGKIEITIKEVDDFYEISIKDNGKGMTSTERDRLFKIEYGFSTVGTNKERGTGLGLIICKEFVEKHNGEIRIESKEGAGSRFIIHLPKVNKN